MYFIVQFKAKVITYSQKNYLSNGLEKLALLSRIVHIFQNFIYLLFFLFNFPYFQIKYKVFELVSKFRIRVPIVEKFARFRMKLQEYKIFCCFSDNFLLKSVNLIRTERKL